MSYKDMAPAVKWAMPPDAPGHADVARRNEYVDDALRKAAEIVFACWEAFASSSWGDEYVPKFSGERETIVADEIGKCRLTLANKGPLDQSFCEAMRWRALQIVNLPKTLASSSAMRERARP